MRATGAVGYLNIGNLEARDAAHGGTAAGARAEADLFLQRHLSEEVVHPFFQSRLIRRRRFRPGLCRPKSAGDHKQHQDEGRNVTAQGEGFSVHTFLRIFLGFAPDTRWRSGKDGDQGIETPHSWLVRPRIPSLCHCNRTILDPFRLDCPKQNASQREMTRLGIIVPECLRRGSKRRTGAAACRTYGGAFGTRNLETRGKTSRPPETSRRAPWGFWRFA